MGRRRRGSPRGCHSLALHGFWIIQGRILTCTLARWLDVRVQYSEVGVGVIFHFLPHVINILNSGCLSHTRTASAADTDEINI
jgi:hypothetical protein